MSCNQTMKNTNLDDDWKDEKIGIEARCRMIGVSLMMVAPIIKEQIDHLTKELKSNPADCNKRLLRAENYYELRGYDEALEDYRQVLKIEPNNLHCHARMGLILAENMGKYEEALKCFIKAKDLANKDGSKAKISVTEQLVEETKELIKEAPAT